MGNSQSINEQHIHLLKALLPGGETKVKMKHLSSCLDKLRNIVIGFTQKGELY